MPHQQQRGGRFSNQQSPQPSVGGYRNEQSPQPSTGGYRVKKPPQQHNMHPPSQRGAGQKIPPTIGYKSQNQQHHTGVVDQQKKSEYASQHSGYSSGPTTPHFKGPGSDSSTQNRYSSPPVRQGQNITRGRVTAGFKRKPGFSEANKPKGGATGRASGQSKTLHADRCSPELLQQIKQEYEQCWENKEGKRSPSKVKIDPNSVSYPPTLAPENLPREKRDRLSTNSWLLQSDIEQVFSSVLRLVPSQDKLDERYLRGMIRKMKRTNKQKMVSCLGNDFVLAGPLIYTFGDNKPCSLNIVENKGRDREYRIEITPRGPLTIKNLQLIHQRLIYKQISQSAMKAQNYFHQKNLWIAELPQNQDKMTVEAGELFTNIDLVLGCRSNVIHATHTRRLQLIVSPGTKKQSTLTVGEMLLKMKRKARDNSQYKYFTREHIVGRNTMLTYRNSATQSCVQIDWDKDEQHLITVISKNTILDWKSARLDFVPKDCVSIDYLNELIKGDDRTKDLPIKAVQVDKDRYIELEFSKLVHRDVFDQLNKVLVPTLKSDEKFKAKVNEAKPGFKFEDVAIVGHKTTILNFVESRYDVKYEEKYFGLPLLYPKQLPNSKKDPDYFLVGFCKLTGFDNESEMTRRKVQASCKLPKFMNCNRRFVKALMKAPHLQIGLDPDATEPQPLVTNPLKLDPVEIKLVINGQTRLITNEHLAKEWQNVSGFVTGNSELKKWAVLYEPSNYSRNAKATFITLVNELRKKRRWPESFLPQPDEFEQDFHLDQQFLQMLKNRAYDMIMVLIQPETQFKYWLTSAIQRETCTKTQFLRLGSLKRKDAVWNAMEQIFYKAGCQLFTVNPGKFCNKLMQNTLVIGVDVCHDDTRRGRFPSIASFCYYLEPFSTFYRDIHAINYFMSPREDIVPFTVMKDMVTHAINDYAQHNKMPPVQILYFRDSIGETRYPLLKRTEEEGIKAAFEMCPCLKGRRKEDMPKIELVICAKRHPHRFDLESIGGGSDGIVIDQEVVCSDYWQFMIQHCRGSQPTQYNVLADGWSVQNHVKKIKAFYEAIHTLTFCYTIAKKGVKLPAQLMWAHHFSQWQNELFQRWIYNLDDLKTPRRCFRPKLYFSGRIQDYYKPTPTVEELFPYPQEDKYRGGGWRGRGRGRGGMRGRGGRGGSRGGFGGYNTRGRGGFRNTRS